jgi:hypothetical protein
MMSEGSTEQTQDVIKADDLVKDLMETKEPVFTLRDKHISGTLDLRYRTIHAAVDMQGCHFLGDVDLRWCNFEQTVDLSRCTFHQAFNKIGQTNAQTIHCKKDFTCAEAIFEGPVSLNSAQIEGTASFKKAQFKSTQEEVNFVGFASTGQLNFTDAIFNGAVNFNSLKCEGMALFDRATFKELATFNSLKCEGPGFFDGATFEGEVDFSFTSFGPALQCLDITFEEKANFDSLKCEGPGFFDGATFEGEVNFSFTSFDAGLECHGTTFEKDVNFSSASLENLDCSVDEKLNATVFNGQVRLYGLRCKGECKFEGAQFRGTQEADLRFGQFGSLRFPDCSFSCPIRMDAVEVSRELDLTASEFREVSLFNATTALLSLAYEVDSTTYTFPRVGASFNLRGFTFNRCNGEKEALRFAGAQKPNEFSVDPYVQLENYYERVGKDFEARDVHYQGRDAVRRNAEKSSDVTWTFGKKASDSFLRILTGYGVRTGRVAWAIIFFLVLGTIMFSLGDFTRWGEALYVVPSEPSVASGAAQNSSASEPTMVDQFTYSVDRFIPINMGFEDRLEPRQSWSRVYSLLHVLAGWLLIPLFLVSWSGLVRSGRR